LLVHPNFATSLSLAGCGPNYTDPLTGYTSTGCPTSFPHATLMGSAFNRTLWHAVASVIGTEGRALHNIASYGLITWAPDINPFRDPRVS
jgi:beta-glucosidase-like glycosyl hydrolase